MKVKIEFSVDNDVFVDDGPFEIRRVCERAAAGASSIWAGNRFDKKNREKRLQVLINEEVDEEMSIRQKEKRKWFKKIKSKEFWESLVDGVDGKEGEEYAAEVYNILYELLGERG